MRIRLLLLTLLLQAAPPPAVLPAAAADQLIAGLEAARRHPTHVWRDTSPWKADTRLTGVVEIARGSRRKYEFDIGLNAPRLDRMMSPEYAYPVNYGFVPQTVSYDGDPFDVLVLGPALASGTIIHGVVLGIMHMEDEKGLDSKAVISPVDAAGQPRHGLTDVERERIAAFFRTYKRDEPGKFSRVTGWGDPDAARAYVEKTHAFFKSCRQAGRDCIVP